MKSLRGMLNPTAAGVMLAVGKADGTLLFSAFTPMSGRDSAGLPEFVAGELAVHGITLDDIDRWTVGAGPGSFTALRLTAALAAAWCFGREEAHLRCVPGAVALGSALPFAEGDRIGCLYDGRNHEVLYFGLCAEGGELVPTGECAVLNAAQAADFAAARGDERFVVAASDAAAAERIFPGRMETVAAPDPAALLNASFAPYDDDPAKLVYIRPAVQSA